MSQHRPSDRHELLRIVEVSGVSSEFTSVKPVHYLASDSVKGLSCIL